MVDNIFDFTLARQALEKLTDTTPRVAYNINAEPQQRKHAITTADGFKSHAVFAITDIFEAKVPISSNNERDDFPFDDIADMMAYEACPDIMDPLFPDWSDKAAIELYYQEKVIQDGIGDYIIKPGDPDYEDPDFPFNNVAELRFVADNFTSDDDEQVDNLLAYYRSGTTQ